MRSVIAFLVFFMVLTMGGLVLLAEAPLSPPVQKVEQVVPDAQLPR